MSNADQTNRHRLVAVAGHVYTEQSTCPIADGQAGIWYGTDGLLHQRNADGSDSVVATQSQASFYVAITRTAEALATTPTYDNGPDDDGVGATLTAGSNAAIGTIGGVALTTVGQVILVTEQATAAQNGLYELTTVGSGSVPWVLTRLPGFDTAETILDGSMVAVQQGTYADLVYSQTATVETVGTSDIVFALSATAVTFTAVATALAAANAAISVNGQKITSLANPAANNDAANKSYVDNRWSISAGPGLSASTNASTVSLNQINVREFQNRHMPVKAAGPTVTGSGAINLSIQRVSVPNGISATRLDLLAALSVVASTHNSYTISVAAYTFAVSTASSASSTSVGVSIDSTVMTRHNSTRYHSVPLATWNVTPGEYLFAIMASNAGPAGTTGSFSFYGGSGLSIQGGVGAAGNYSAYFNDGIYSAATGAFPASIHLSDINQSGASVGFQPGFNLLASG